MSQVEFETTTRNIELANSNPELVKRREHESKLLVTKPEAFEGFKVYAAQLDAIYLSNPTDEFSLRVRREQTAEGFIYSATLKDRGEVKDGVKSRLEINVDNLHPEAYEYYAAKPEFTPFQQFRTHITDAMTIDFIEGHAPIIEIETPDSATRELLMQHLEGMVEVKSDNPNFDKESIAHYLAGNEILASPESLDSFASRVANEMIAQYVTGKKQVVTGLTGMSGAGKTTVTKAISEKMKALIGEDYAPLVVSTDDYHFGKAYLEKAYGAPWTEWDDPRTYNTAELASDLVLMAEGQSLIRRHFDFTTEEPVFDNEVPPAAFVIIEGLYAGSKDLEDVRDLHFNLPTSVATSIGRDIRRLVIENRANRVFPTPESRLKYQLETALPLFLEQEQPRKKGFSASVRPMASRAFMLERITAQE